LRKLCSAEVITATDNNRDLNSGTGYIGDLLGNILNNIGINTDALFATKNFSRKFKEHSPIRTSCTGHECSSNFNYSAVNRWLLNQV
jgi:hypothetical protein